MDVTQFVLLALAGGLGAVSRFVLVEWIAVRWRGTLPWGTILINLSGSLVLGLITGLAMGHLLPETWRLILGTGFLGGYTTFSTASVETVRLLRQGRVLATLGNALGTLLATVLAAGLGLWLGLAF